MQTIHPTTTQLIDMPLQVGEGPVWDDRRNVLLFEDIPAPALFAYDPATGTLRRWEMPAPIGSFGLCEDGRVLVALRTGLHFFDLESGRIAFFVHPEPDRPDNRLNDGKVGPDGRFWVGSMGAGADLGPTGALYRIDPDGSCARMLDGLIVSNGLAWSPDGRTLYHSDSRQRFLSAWDYNLATGDITNRRVLRSFEDADGRPDGAATDAEGYYWSAGVSAGCLNRIAPDGTIERKLILPVPAPTMPCFAGPDLRTLYVTSLTRAVDGRPVAGTLLRVECDVAGAPVGRFGKPFEST
ncbi:MAG TPA: SMP-30/gluconolactonase/LRE family protein [Alphaproteobacteria bacterium]|nr:SMP-30/gluconolactonase/LRE family protein [Alphaproteobacteria bacterium]